MPDDDEEVDDEDDEDDDEGLEVLGSIPNTFLRANAGAGLSGTRHSAVAAEEKESMQKRSAPSPGGSSPKCSCADGGDDHDVQAPSSGLPVAPYGLGTQGMTKPMDPLDVGVMVLGEANSRGPGPFSIGRDLAF